MCTVFPQVCVNRHLVYVCVCVCLGPRVPPANNLHWIPKDRGFQTVNLSLRFVRQIGALQ